MAENTGIPDNIQAKLAHLRELRKDPVRRSRKFEPQVQQKIGQLESKGIQAPTRVLQALARHDVAAEAVGVRRKEEIRREKEERKKAEENSYIDSLTGLPNRRAFDEQFVRAVAHANRTGAVVVLLELDLDHFKGVNDTYGHQVGDEVLKKVALLPARKDEPIYRVGGEEFYQIVTNGVMQEDVTKLMTRYAESIKDSTKILLGNVQPLVNIGTGDVPRQVSVSMGATIYSNGESQDAFNKRADEALYMAKNNGRNQGCIKLVENGEPRYIQVTDKE